MLDVVLRFVAAGITVYIISLSVAGIIPSYVPRIHPSFMAVGVCMFFSQGIVAYTANFGSNVRARCWQKCVRVCASVTPSHLSWCALTVSTTLSA